MVLIVLADCTQRLETQRLDALFDLLDFNHSGKLSLDELTVLFVCLANAVSSISESDEVPSEEIITVMTLNIFDKLKRASNGSITRSEFKQWCSTTLESLGGNNFDVIYQTFCSGGPIVEEEEPEDGIPKLMSATEDKSSKKINKSPEKKPVFLPTSAGILLFNALFLFFCIDYKYLHSNSDGTGGSVPLTYNLKIFFITRMTYFIIMLLFIFTAHRKHDKLQSRSKHQCS
jgi:hypothetical protein